METLGRDLKPRALETPDSSCAVQPKTFKVLLRISGSRIFGLMKGLRFGLGRSRLAAWPLHFVGLVIGACGYLV